MRRLAFRETQAPRCRLRATGNCFGDFVGAFDATIEKPFRILPLGGPVHGSGGGGGRARSPVRYRASRHQARQSHGGCARPALGHRLRPGPVPRQRRVNANRRRSRHPAVHESRTGIGPTGVARSPYRRLFARRHPVRTGDARTYFSRHGSQRTAAADLERRTASSPAPGQEGPSRTGNHHSESGQQISLPTATARPTRSPPICSAFWTTNRSWRLGPA